MIKKQKGRAPETGAFPSLWKKSGFGWAFSHKYGKMGMGDVKCCNEGN
jgi:hypothetical protein